MPWISDAGKQDIDLPHGENALETATDDVLDRERLSLVDLSIGWSEMVRYKSFCYGYTHYLCKTVRA